MRVLLAGGESPYSQQPGVTPLMVQRAPTITKGNPAHSPAHLKRNG
jgi:hypothetical protein